MRQGRARRPRGKDPSAEASPPRHSLDEGIPHEISEGKNPERSNEQYAASKRMIDVESRGETERDRRGRNGPRQHDEQLK